MVQPNVSSVRKIITRLRRNEISAIGNVRIAGNRRNTLISYGFVIRVIDSPELIAENSHACIGKLPAGVDVGKILKTVKQSGVGGDSRRGGIVGVLVVLVKSIVKANHDAQEPGDLSVEIKRG